MKGKKKSLDKKNKGCCFSKNKKNNLKKKLNVGMRIFHMLHSYTQHHELAEACIQVHILGGEYHCA